MSKVAFEFVITTLLLICALSTAALASVSEWVPFDREQDLKPIISERVGTPLKLEVIKSATQSIDVVTYDERCDPEFDPSDPDRIA